jgi:hypothetical protein
VTKEASSSGGNTQFESYTGLSGSPGTYAFTFMNVFFDPVNDNCRLNNDFDACDSISIGSNTNVRSSM